MIDTDLEYPVMCFWPDFVDAHADAMAMGHTNALALKNRTMVGLEVVDSKLRLLRITEAKKEHGVGRFRGYNLFFNQEIKARLSLTVVREDVEIQEVRSRVISTMKKNRSMYESGGNVDEMVAEITNAQTFEDVVALLI